MEIIEDDLDTVLVRFDVFVTMSRKEFEILEEKGRMNDSLAGYYIA